MTKSVVVLLLVLGGFVKIAPAKAEKDSAVSKMFCQAHFFYVKTADGDVLDPNMPLLQQIRSAVDAQCRDAARSN